MKTLILATSRSGKPIDATRLVGGRGNMGGNHPVSIPCAGQLGSNGLNSSAVADGTAGNYYAATTGGCVSPTGVCTAAPSSDGRNGPAINLIPNVAGGTFSPAWTCQRQQPLLFQPQQSSPTPRLQVQTTCRETRSCLQGA